MGRKYIKGKLIGVYSDCSGGRTRDGIGPRECSGPHFSSWAAEMKNIIVTSSFSFPRTSGLENEEILTVWWYVGETEKKVQ